MMAQKTTLETSTAFCALMVWLLIAGSAHAQTALPPVSVPVVPDQAEQNQAGLKQPLDTSLLNKQSLQSKLPSVTETAQFLDGLPGVGLYSAGGFSSLPTVRGMNDDRINTLVDGVPLIAACPNHMNPVLSYVQPSNVSSIQVMSGITPVSKGGDSIGGTIEVKTAPPIFASGDAILTQGSLSSFFKSVNRALTLSANGVIANDKLSFAYAGSGAEGRDYKDGDGNRIAATRFIAQNHDIKVAFKGDGTLAEMEFGLQSLPFEGFPNQFMDMLGNQSRFASGRYQSDQSWGQLDAKAYWRYTTHYMNFLSDRYTTSSMPMNTKETEAGYVVKGDVPLSNQNGTVRVGNEYHFNVLNDWWRQGTGMMNPNIFANVHNATRNRVGTFIEWEAQPLPQWTTLLGIRNDTVMMDTGNVQGYRSAGYAADAAAFNALDHQKTDINFDVTALAQYEASKMNTDEIGYAHKTRSPNFYERYAWSTGAMASSMIGWFGDANGYVGSVSLRPEQANIFSSTIRLHDNAKQDWDVKLTPYYNYIRDYIGVDYRGSNAMMAKGASLLQFANHDAMTYGLELTGAKALLKDDTVGQVDVTGTGSLQRGYEINNGNSLYHMMPLGFSLAVKHQLGGWSNVVEVKATSSKSEADPLRHEPFTPGFAVINFRTAYDWRNIRLDAGIDNLLNQQYYSPLGGVDLADWKANHNTNVPLIPLASPGRSYNAGVTVKF